jgi:hypothetical protein
VYTRPPDRVTEYRQELLLDLPRLKISRLEVAVEAEPLRIGLAKVPPGGSILWFAFPGRWYEVAAVFDATDKLVGHYTNIVHPPDFAPGEWRITDLFLDVWQAPDAEPVLLDGEDLADALAVGAISATDADAARREADAVLASARAGRWPPREVRQWTAADVRSLRYRRDAPATWHANRIVGRIIAFGIYLLGLVSLTSLAFSGLTDAFVNGGRALFVFVAMIAAEAAILLPLALAGWLPATHRPRLEESMTEKTLFIGALVSGAAVLLNPNADLWRGALAGVYGVLAVFLSIFGVCRIVYGREVPWMAIAGVAVSLLALIALL